MGYSNDQLKAELLKLYPEIKSYGLAVALEFDKDKNAYVVTFSKDGHSRHAFLDKGDADSCLEGNACIYLGVLIAQYIKDLEDEIKGK